MALDDEPDWYLPAWMATLRVRQVDLIEATGYGKSKVSELVSGKMKYKRDILNAVAGALNIEPFELLLHPVEAMALRRFRESALQIAADRSVAYGAPTRVRDAG